MVQLLGIGDQSTLARRRIYSTIVFLRNEGFITYYKQNETHGALTYDVYYITNADFMKITNPDVEAGHAKPEYIAEVRSLVEAEEASIWAEKI